MARMDLVVTAVGDADASECVTPQGVTMTFDDPDTGTHGASPVQHLLASIGACALVDVGIILRKKRIPCSGLKVTCAGERRDEPFPRVFTSIMLTFEATGVPQKVMDEVVAMSVEKYCSCAGTVVEGAKIEHRSIVHP